MKKTIRNQQREAIRGGTPTLADMTGVLFNNQDVLNEFIRIADRKTNPALAKEMKRLEEELEKEALWTPKIKKYDNDRLKLVLELCVFFEKHLKICEHPNKLVKELLEGVDLINKRWVLEHICELIGNLSNEFRDKFNDCIPIKPFYWETFEKLGSLMKLWRLGSDHTPGSQLHASGLMNLAKEFAAQELIVEAAINDLMQEIGEIKRLAKFMLDNTNGTLEEMKIKKFGKVDIPIIIAFVARVGDTKSIRELLKLTNNSLYISQYSQWSTGIIENFNVSPIFVPNEIEDFRHASLLEKHAFLRRLQNIGELLTAKNLSTQSLNLIKSINCRAICDIRNVLTHQEKAIHKQKIDELLTKPGILSNAFKDMEVLYEKIQELNTERVKQLPFPVASQADEDTEEEEKIINDFWNKVKKSVNDSTEAAAKHTVSATLKPKFAKESLVKEFIDKLRSEKIPDEHIDKWLSVFNLDVVNKSSNAELIKELRTYVPDNDKFNELQDLLKQARNSKKDKKSKGERTAEHKKLQENKELKDLNVTATLPGINAIHNLFFPLSYNSYKDAELSYDEHVMCAAEALKNIRNFIEGNNGIKSEFNKLVKGEQITEALLLKFLDSLSKRTLLYASIEYNASLLFCHLPKVVSDQSKLKDIVGFKSFIDNDFQREMRALRNHLEHGRPMADAEEAKVFQPTIYPNLSTKQTVICLNLVLLLKTLYPLLLKLRVKLLKEEVKALDLKPIMLKLEKNDKKLNCERTQKELLFAVKSNDVERVKDLCLNKPDYNLDEVNEKGFTVLHVACISAATSLQREDPLEIIKILIRCGASLEPATPVNKMPLEYLDDETVIRLLCAIINEHGSKKGSNSHKLPLDLQIKQDINLEQVSKHDYYDALIVNNKLNSANIDDYPGYTVNSQINLQNGWNCFDVAVGIDRNEIVSHALKRANDLEHRQLLAPELKHAIAETVSYLNHSAAYNSPPPGILPAIMHTEEMKEIYNEYDFASEQPQTKELLVACNNALGKREGERLNKDELMEFFNDNKNMIMYGEAYQYYMQYMSNILSYELRLSEYAQREDIYRNYVNEYYGKREWFCFITEANGERATSMIDIVAKMLQTKIVIHQIGGKDYSTADYSVGKPEEIHVGYNGNSHFVGLQKKYEMNNMRNQGIDQLRSQTIISDVEKNKKLNSNQMQIYNKDDTAHHIFSKLVFTIDGEKIEIHSHDVVKLACDLMCVEAGEQRDTKIISPQNFNDLFNAMDNLDQFAALSKEYEEKLIPLLVIPAHVREMKTLKEWLFVAKDFDRRHQEELLTGWWLLISGRLLLVKNTKGYLFYVSDHGLLSDIINAIKQTVFEFPWEDDPEKSLAIAKLCAEAPKELWNELFEAVANESLEVLKAFHPDNTDEEILEMQSQFKDNPALQETQKQDFHQKNTYIHDTILKKYNELKSASKTKDFDKHFLRLYPDDIELAHKETKLFVLMQLARQINSGKHEPLFRPIGSYGEVDKGDPYHKFEASVSKYLSSSNALSPMELAEKVCNILTGHEIKNDELAFLPNLVAAWFVAEVARNPVTLLTSMMQLDMLRNGIQLNDKFGNNLYSWKYTFINTKNAEGKNEKGKRNNQFKIKDFYGDDIHPHDMGGSHPMAGTDSEKMSKAGLKSGENLNAVRQKEGNLILHWLFLCLNKMASERFSVDIFDINQAPLETSPQYDEDELKKIQKKIKDKKKDIKFKEYENLDVDEENRLITELEKKEARLLKKQKLLDSLIEPLLKLRTNKLENLLNSTGTGQDFIEELLANFLAKNSQPAHMIVTRETFTPGYDIVKKDELYIGLKYYMMLNGKPRINYKF